MRQPGMALAASGIFTTEGKIQMPMQIITWKVETDKPGASWTGEIEVKIGTTDAEVEQLVAEQIVQFVRWSWVRGEILDA